MTYYISHQWPHVLEDKTTSKLLGLNLGQLSSHAGAQTAELAAPANRRWTPLLRYMVLRYSIILQYIH